MSDRPTSTDLMAGLEELKADMGGLRTDVSKLVKSRDDHERRISEVESQQVQGRELVTRLHERIAEMSGTVTAVLDLAQRHEKITRDIFRDAAQQLSGDVTALVRAELSGLRGEFKEIKERLDTRPCVAAPSAGCPVHEVRALKPTEESNA